MYKKLLTLKKYFKILEKSPHGEDTIAIHNRQRIKVLDHWVENSKKLSNAQTVEPKPEFVVASKNRIFDQVMQVQRVQTQTQRTHARQKPAFRTFIANPVFSIFLLLILGFGFVGSVQAADTSSPGDMLYFLDLAIENAKFKLATSDVQRVELLMDFSDERLEEAIETLSLGETSNAEIALAHYESHLHAVRNLILEASDEIQPNLIAILASHNENQLAVFNQMVASVNSEELASILQALSTSSHTLYSADELPESSGIEIHISTFLKFSADTIVNPKDASESPAIEGQPDPSSDDWLPPGIIDNPEHSDELPPGLEDKEKPPGQGKDKQK